MSYPGPLLSLKINHFKPATSSEELRMSLIEEKEEKEEKETGVGGQSPPLHTSRNSNTFKILFIFNDISGLY